MREGRGNSDCKPPKTKLCRIWHIIAHSRKTPCGDPCVEVPGHILHKPDPCIYDQFLLMAMHLPVTWDSPDVRILLGSLEQNTYDLTAGTTYNVEITVHNSSRLKAADGTSVDVGWIEFGAGPDASPDFDLFGERARLARDGSRDGSLAHSGRSWPLLH